MKQTFYAEIKKVEARKTASNDVEIRFTVATDQVEVMDLGKLPANTIVEVTVKAVPRKEQPPSYHYV